MAGMNAASAVALGDPNQALLLENWLYDQYGISVRGGHAEYADSVGDEGTPEVRTLIACKSKTKEPFFGDPFVAPGPGHLFAATDDGIYDVTAGGSLSAKVLTLSGAALAGHISYVEFPTAGGLFVAACSETDGYLIYTESTNTWSKPIMGTDPGEINGVDPAKFVFVIAWKRRLLFVERDTGKMWAMEEVNSIAGNVLAFDFGSLFTHGGVLSQLASWTMDAGVGIDDHLLVLSSKGDLGVYKGIDPTDPAQFSQVGVWFIGAPPAGRRAMTQYGGEVAIVSETGITPVSEIIQGGSAKTAVAFRIRPMLSQQVRDSGDLYGWGMTIYPALNYLIINTPPDVPDARQYALALNFGAWSIWTGYPALCFEVFNGYLYFGTSDGRVCVALYGDLDDMDQDLEEGRAIVSKMTGTYQSYASAAMVKQFHMIRPVLDARMKPQAALWMNVDYKLSTSRASPAFRPINVSKWDQSKWDSARWTGSQVPYNDWFSVEGMGRVASIGFAMSSIAGARLYQFDVLYEQTKGKIF
jgi:hypothetical protein